jgi:hypothetical protein
MIDSPRTDAPPERGAPERDAAERNAAQRDAAGPAVPAARQVAGRRWRRARGPLVAALVVILVGIALAVLQPNVERNYLDPTSASKEGSRALVRVAETRGTGVRVARSAPEAARLMRSSPKALLVVVRSERLLASDHSALAGVPGDRLLVEPNLDTLRVLAPGVEPAGQAQDDQPPPNCSLDVARLAGSANVGGAVYSAPPGSTKCYPDPEGGLPGLVRLSQGERTVTVLGSGAPLTNRRLAESGNAALGVNLLTGRTGVVWLLPDVPAPGSAGQKSPLQLIPAEAVLAALQIAIAALFVVWWRVRRLGPVVTESLPVVVRSAEAVEGRARLYRARRARDRAADALRSGFLDRLMPLLALSRSVVQGSLAGDTTRQIEVASRIAARTGVHADTIGMALYGPAPEEDAELVALADFLDELEEHVRRS